MAWLCIVEWPNETEQHHSIPLPPLHSRGWVLISASPHTMQLLYRVIQGILHILSQ